MHGGTVICANLYGTMTLWHAWELFQHVEPEVTAKKKILRKDFFSFAEIVRVEKHAYAIMLLPKRQKTTVNAAICRSVWILSSVNIRWISMHADTF